MEVISILNLSDLIFFIIKNQIKKLIYKIESKIKFGVPLVDFYGHYCLNEWRAKMENNMLLRANK